MAFAVTAQVPSGESVLVALRDAISRAGEHGPFGGLPGAVRVDRTACQQALGRRTMTRPRGTRVN
jgi:hypothetical protein